MTRIALITGASRGLGAACAQQLCATHHIVALARTQGALEELDDRIKQRGGAATLAPMDVSDPGAMATLCRGIYDRWGRVDLWVHTAVHAVLLSPADHTDSKDWDRSIAVNATATARLIPFVAPLLGRSGRAVFFDDPAAPGAKFYGSYGASKAAQMAIVRSWAAETVRTGPQVDIVTPQPMATALRARFHPGEDRSALAQPAHEAARLFPAQ